MIQYIQNMNGSFFHFFVTNKIERASIILSIYFLVKFTYCFALLNKKTGKQNLQPVFSLNIFIDSLLTFRKLAPNPRL